MAHHVVLPILHPALVVLAGPAGEFHFERKRKTPRAGEMLLEMLVDNPSELTRSDRKCSLLLIMFGQRSRVYHGCSSSQCWKKVECVFNEVVPAETGGA